MISISCDLAIIVSKVGNINTNCTHLNIRSADLRLTFPSRRITNYCLLSANLLTFPRSNTCRSSNDLSSSTAGTDAHVGNYKVGILRGSAIIGQKYRLEPRPQLTGGLDKWRLLRVNFVVMVTLSLQRADKVKSLLLLL